MIQKKITILCLVVLGLLIPCTVTAQNNDSTRDLFQAYLAPINTNLLDTDFLLNRGFMNDDEISSLYQFIESYDEETNSIVPPNNSMDGTSWTQIYSSILESNVNRANNLPSLASIDTRLNSTYGSASTTPILIFDVKGELLDETEVQNAIENNTKIAPYNQIHLFGASAYKNTFYSPNVYFDLTTSNYISGFDTVANHVYIDFSDGRGKQRYSTDSGEIYVNYSDIGEKSITVYRDATLNGTTTQISSSFIITIKANTTETAGAFFETTNTSFSLQEGATIPHSNNNLISNNGATAHCFLSRDAVFDKPIIIVQGFDPTGEITVNAQRLKYNRFENDLRDQGFDIVYLMLNNTSLPLQSNANSVKDIIQQVNTEKQGNFESILIGESMGGLLSRMALKQLENNKYDHMIGLYISFDAPHQGANLPPGVLHLFEDLLETRLARGVRDVVSIIEARSVLLSRFIINTFTAENGRTTSLSDALLLNLAYDALDALNSPAARSMLVRHIAKDGLFEDTQNTLEDLGYPQTSRNIALINGSNNNSDLQRLTNNNRTLIPGEQLIRFPLWRFDCNEFSLNAWSSAVNQNARVSRVLLKVGIPIPEIKIRWENRCILKLFGRCRLRTKIPVRVRIGTTCATTNLIDKDRHFRFDGAAYDNAPGSTLPGLDDFSSIVNSNISFVPTASAIDLSESAYNNVTDPKGLRAVTNSTTLDNIIRNDLTPFDEVYAKRGNSTHVFFNNRDTANFRTIINDEFMRDNLDLQNRIIQFDRDFEAETIHVGNNVNRNNSKIYSSGNVIVTSNTTVNLTAKNQIRLFPGTHLNKGSHVNLVTYGILKSNLDTSFLLASKASSNSPYFDIKLLGKDNYSIGSSPSFKVLTSDTNTDYTYNWEILNTSELLGNNDTFTINDLLYPGVYTVKVTVTSKITSNYATTTKVFKITSNYNNSDTFSSKNALESKTVGGTESFMLYPNPIENEVTIIGEKDITKVAVYDMFTNRILVQDAVNQNWLSLQLSHLNTGSYIVEVFYKDQSEPIRQKLIKQ
jgi:pimeloyl-ACP methyl ester carboxylesterase